MDVPDWALDRKASPSVEMSLHKHLQMDSKELEKHWTALTNTRDILYHLCLVSAGMAGRPRRPDRTTIFRPFSSRDAHILLQLKRTKEVADGKQVDRVLEVALRAGKAARNVDKVPDLARLREYGTGDSKYASGEAPPEILDAVKDAVLQLAILPLVKEGIAATRITRHMDAAIVELRNEAQQMATNEEERIWIQKRLHQPTLDLRSGKMPVQDVRKELFQIREELQAIIPTLTRGK